MTAGTKFLPKNWIYLPLRVCTVPRLFFDRPAEALMLGAQAQPGEGSLEARVPPARGRPHLRSDPRRSADSADRAFEILDDIELGAAEDERLAHLVKAAQGGDPFAFADLYVALFDRVHRWLQIALKDREEAQDAAQQVFMRAFEALPRYNEIRGFRPWVFSIARNLAFDRLHAASRGTHPMDPALLAKRRELLSRDTPDADPASMYDGIDALIADLPENQRRVVRLRFVTDMAADDIGDLLGITTDAVRHTQQRALRSLARSLAGDAERSGGPARLDTAATG
jgi:RNA polymerase sigma-70 factor (ECF subfamily)